MKALSSFTVSNLYEFLSSAEQDRTVDITSSTSKVGKKKYFGRKSMGYINDLVTDILQNIVFCVQQKREIHTGLKQLKGE